MTDVLFERDARVLRVILNRESRRNALSEAMCHAIVEQIETAWTDPAIGCVLIEARGSVFCAGMDLDEATAPGAADRTELHERLFTLGLRAVKPLVASIQGPALGGGVGLVANAHVAVAAQGVSFALTEIRIGMWPFVISRALNWAVGERRALELSLTGRQFTASDALTYCLITEIAPAFELEDRATQLAHLLADGPQETIRLGLRYLREARGLPEAEAGKLARNLRRQVFDSRSFTEGVRAMREKRKPQWPDIV